MIQLINILKKRLPLLISLGYVLFLVYMMTQNKFSYAAVIPGGILILYWSFFRINSLLLFVAFFTPLSTSLEELGIYNPLGVEMALPTEPILFGLMMIAIYKSFFHADRFKPMMTHGITKAILFYLAWMLFTVFWSSMPMVSAKFFISKLWFIFSFFVLGHIFFKDIKNYQRFIYLFTLSMVLVVIVTIIRHGFRGFDKFSAHFIMSPFFKDHTVYGAILAFLLPITLGAMWNKAWSNRNRIFFIISNMILIAGIILSYTRAAWLSLVLALGVYVVIKMKISFRFLATTLVILGTMFFSFQTEIFFMLTKNTQDSSGNFSEHIQSMSNISTDASNLERLNRWNSAITLWEEEPLFGWGPGTYQFQYAPKQMSYDKTIISTMEGDMGNSHSEYLGPLAETGVPGLISVLILIIVFFTKSIRLYSALDDPRLKNFVLGIILANVTYFSHGILNNYLDVDKASVPVWASFAFIVTLDLFYRGKGADNLSLDERSEERIPS